MLTFVTFKWQSPGYRSRFEASHVLTLRRMIQRHYTQPHRFICVTDDRKGLDAVETYPLWPEYANVPSPHGNHNPSCYRRLKLFAPDAGTVFGERLVCMDLDTVIVSNIDSLFDRPEDFVIWGQSDFPGQQWYNGSLWMLRTGTRTRVWTEFNPKLSPIMAKKNGHKGSDQGWFSYILGPREATWTIKDGVYSFRVHIRSQGAELPANARIVNFHGRIDPWSYQAQTYPWIREHYGAA